MVIEARGEHDEGLGQRRPGQRRLRRDRRPREDRAPGRGHRGRVPQGRDRPAARPRRSSLAVHAAGPARSSSCRAGARAPRSAVADAPRPARPARRALRGALRRRDRRRGPRLPPRVLGHLAEVPAGDDGRRGGAPRRRRRRPARPLLRERRAHRRPDAARRASRSRTGRATGTGSTSRRRTAGSRTRPGRRARRRGLQPGHRGRRLRRRRRRRPVRHRRLLEPPLPQRRRRPLHRRHGRGRDRAAASWSTSAAFVDFDHDGRLDLFVGRYMQWSFGYNPHCSAAYNPFPEQSPTGPRAYCHPNLFKGATALLYRNEGGGRFRDVSKEAGVANPGGKSLGVAIADFDGDGLTDVFVANDAVQQFLYRNRGDGRFEERGPRAFAAFDQDGKAFSGMGVDFADYDNDGRPDVVVTNLSNQCYALFRNLGDRTFSYETHASGLGRISLLSLRLGRALPRLRQRRLEGPVPRPGPRPRHDRADLAPPALPAAAAARPERGRPLPRRLGRARATSSSTSGRRAALAIGDIDDDGDLDVVVNDARRPRPRAAQRGRATPATGSSSGSSAAGATATASAPRCGSSRARAQLRHATARTAGGYLSAGDRRVHLGLGEEKAVRPLEVRWPSGTVQRLTDVAVGSGPDRHRAVGPAGGPQAGVWHAGRT